MNMDYTINYSKMHHEKLKYKAHTNVKFHVFEELFNTGSQKVHG